MESLDGFNVSPKPDLGYSRVTEKKDIILSSVFLCGVFFITMNDIFDSATAFNNLTQIEYEFKLGRKNKIITLNINFQKYQFHHLVGLQYLTDIHELDKDREIVLDDILNKRIILD